MIAALAFSIAACAPRPQTRAIHGDAALDEELRRLDAALDRIEERLLASQATVSFWDELRERHETVSEVTCSTLSAHARAIESFLKVQRDKGRSNAKNRLASQGLVPPAAYR